MQLHKLAGAALLAIGTLIPTSLAAQTTELLFNSYLPRFDPTYRVAVQDFSKQIEKESGGTIKIKIPDATLAPSDQQYSMLLDGVADMAFISIPDLPQHVTLNQIAQLPYNVPNAQAASVALWETYQKYFEKVGELKGVKTLSTHVLAGRGILGLRHPIHSADDLAGKKFWVPPGAMGQVVKGIGAVPVFVTFPEVFDAVSKNMVDGLIATPGTATNARVGDRVKYYTKIPGGLGAVTLSVAISDASWNKLSKEQQAAMLRAADGLPKRTGAAIDEVEGKALEKMPHLQTTDVPPALMEKIKPVLDKQIENWKKQASARGIVDPEEVLTFYRGVAEREAASR